MDKYIDSIWLTKEIPEYSYLSKLAFVQYLKEGKSISFDNNVTFFVGENGTGKSTLLEAIAVRFGLNAEGGTNHYDFATTQEEIALADHINYARKMYPKDSFFLRAESFYNVATKTDEYKPNWLEGESLHEMSHGESFMKVMKERFFGKGMYFLDEPESALSTLRQLSLISIIDELIKNGSQFIIATHSPILLAYPGATIYEFSSEGIQQVAYEDTEVYRLYKSFIENPSRMIDRLLEE